MVCEGCGGEVFGVGGQGAFEGAFGFVEDEVVA